MTSSTEQGSRRLELAMVDAERVRIKEEAALRKEEDEFRMRKSEMMFTRGYKLLESPIPGLVIQGQALIEEANKLLGLK